MAVDPFSGGDTRTMLSAQEMFRSINNGNIVIQGLGEQLEICCQTLTGFANKNLDAMASLRKKLVKGVESIVAKIKNAVFKSS